MPIIPRNRQTVVISVICFLVVIVTLVFVYGFPNNGSETKDLSANITTTQQDVSTSTDWQKSFYEVAGSSTKYYNTDMASSSNSSSSPEVLTNTDILGRNFLVTYAQMYQAGVDSDSSTINTVASKLASNSLSNVGPPKVYYTEDIKTVSDSPTSAGAYAQSLGQILALAIPPENEAVIAQNAFDKADMTILKKIDPIIDGYKKAISSLLETPVPKSASQYHLELINGLGMELFNAQSLRHVDSDPVTGLAAISQEIPALQRINTNLLNLQGYFNTNNITISVPIPSQ